jgi:hypothetical protein
VPDLGPGDAAEDIWPVEPSEAAADVLADPALPVETFSTIVALTVAIAQDPWLAGSREAEPGSMWRTLPIPRGGGIVEYVIIDDEHRVILTRIVPF